MVQLRGDVAEADGWVHLLGLPGGFGDGLLQVTFHLFHSHLVARIIDGSKALLAQASLEVQQARQIGLGRGIAGIELERLFKLGNGLVHLAFTP